MGEIIFLALGLGAWGVTGADAGEQHEQKHEGSMLTALITMRHPASSTEKLSTNYT